MSTLGDRLLGRLRGRNHATSDPQSSPADILPALPTVHEVRQAVAAAGRGRTVDTDILTGLLLAVARSAGAGLVARVEQLLATAEPRLWLALDVSARRSSWHAPTWSSFLVHRLGDGDPQPLELILAACHHDGHVREAAVARLTELDHILVPPVLALRAADWVSQVRGRARLCCERQLTDSPAATLPVLAPVAFALRERYTGHWLGDAVESMLREGPPEVLTKAMTVTDWRTRRAAYLIGLTTGRLTLEQMLHAARTDTDLPIRVRCADAAIRTSRNSGNPDAARQLLSSRTAAVRAEAVHVLGLAGDTTAAESALTDRSALVRATGQATLRHAGRNPTATYRTLIAGQQPPEPACLAGLGETGDAADAELLLPWLAHPRPRGRAEAVRALRRIGHSPTTLLLPLLTDPAAAVTRQVTLSLRGQAGTLDEHHLRHLLATDRPRHIRVAAYVLLHASDTWTRLAVDLQLVDDPLPVLRNRSRTDLVNWLMREAATTYSGPPTAHKRHLTTLLAQAEPTLGADRTRILRFHMGLRR